MKKINKIILGTFIIAITIAAGILTGYLLFRVLMT